MRGAWQAEVAGKRPGWFRATVKANELLLVILPVAPGPVAASID